MKLVFLLSGRHPEIGEWEIRQLCKTHRIRCDFKRMDRLLLVKTDRHIPFVNRLALTHEVSIFHDIVRKSEIEKLNFEVSSGHSACIRVKKIGFHRENSEKIEKSLGAILHRHGVRINLESPEVIERVYLVNDLAIAGELIFRSSRKKFQERAPKNRPFFFPGVILPDMARALVNLTGVQKGGILVDPMCGTGSFLIEAELTGIRAVGMDALDRMVRGSEKNLHFCGCNGHLITGNALQMPFHDGVFDALVTDFPYGRSTRIVGERQKLYRKVIEEAHRVTARNSFSVFVSMEDIEDHFYGLFESIRKFKDRVHKSLTRRIYLVQRI